MESTWGEEVARLKRALEPRRAVRVTYRWKATSSPRSREFRATAPEEPELWAALFEPAAPTGTPALLEVRLDSSGPVDRLRQGEVVEAAGRVEPGGALAVVLPDGGVLWPSYPATRSLRPPRLEAVDGIVEPVRRPGPPRWWTRLPPRLTIVTAAVVVVVRILLELLH